MGKLMIFLISPNYSPSLVKGRWLMDEVVVDNEVVDLARKTWKECLSYKVNFERAYNPVNCGFLYNMSGRFGFDTRRRLYLICACVFLVVI